MYNVMTPLLTKYVKYTGEVQYNERLEDIRILKLDIKKLRRERALLSKSVSNAEELKYEYNIISIHVHVYKHYT